MKTKKSTLVKILAVSGALLILFLLFSYWYMVRCEGQWEEIPLEAEMGDELKGIENELKAIVSFFRIPWALVVQFTTPH